MQFAKALRPRVQRGEITCSIRVWMQPRVKVGGRYALPPGEIEVLSVACIEPDQVTEALARRSGFDSLDELWKVARHGRGEYVFLVDFTYHAPCEV